MTETRQGLAKDRFATDYTLKGLKCADGITGKYFLAMILWTAVSSSLCCKKDNILPPVTSSGQNTFGCYIDGKLFTNAGFILYGRNLNVSYAFKDTTASDTSIGNQFAPYLLISGENRNSTGTAKIITLLLHHSQPEAGKSYLLGKYLQDVSSAHYVMSVASDSGFLETHDSTDTGFTGILAIARFDTAARIASGTFSFNARAENGDTVRFTEGRFDIKF